MTVPLRVLAADARELLASGLESKCRFKLRSPSLDDLDLLADLYHKAYPQDFVADVEVARREIEEDFCGRCGPYDFSASKVVLDDSPIAPIGVDVAVGAIHVVKKSPWLDTPPGAFVTQLSVAPSHRRLGIATVLLKSVAEVLVLRADAQFECRPQRTEVTIGLKVHPDNVAAVTLYQRLGFHPWHRIR